jgi:hypothetical protein
VAVAEREPDAPAEVELYDPKVYFRDAEVVMFEVKYRLTKGKLDKFYECQIAFPGTPNAGIKDMSRSELRAEGVIRDGVRLYKLPVMSYEISLSEGRSSRGPWKKISNVLRGTIQE